MYYLPSDQEAGAGAEAGTNPWVGAGGGAGAGNGAGASVEAGTTFGAGHRSRSCCHCTINDTNSLIGANEATAAA